MRITIALAISGVCLSLLTGCCKLRQQQVALVADTVVSCTGNPVIIDVLSNDRLGNATVNSLSIPTQPVSGGTAVVNTDNTITFTPAGGATGQATFNYQVCFTNDASDQQSSSTDETCKTAQVTVYLRQSDSAPTAVDDAATTPQGVSTLIDVLANDTDPDSALPGGAGLRIADVATPNLGTAVVEGNGVRYTPPNSTFTGDATFQYTITDSCGNSATASAVVTVGEQATAASAATADPAPAEVLLNNNSSFEITVSIGGKEVDVVQPLGSTVVPAAIASGANQAVEVSALLPSPEPARVTNSMFNFAPNGRYTVTYANDNIQPAAIAVTETP